jgi:peroxiredoxin
VRLEHVGLEQRVVRDTGERDAVVLGISPDTVKAQAKFKSKFELPYLLLADSAPDQKLVIVSMDFQRLTDSLFVVLNDKNEITGVDFPNEPVKPAAAR